MGQDLIKLTVLPLENISFQKESGIFCRYFSEDLITELSRFRQLSVVRHSFDNLTDNSSDPRNNIKTGYFVQGTFRSEKGRVKINVQLYDSKADV